MSEKQRRGFAAMSPEQRKEIAARGGRAVPKELRSYSQIAGLAAESGRKGGKGVAREKRSFSADRSLAAAAGKKGGRAPHVKRGRTPREVAEA